MQIPAGQSFDRTEKDHGQARREHDRGRKGKRHAGTKAGKARLKKGERGIGPATLAPTNTNPLRNIARPVLRACARTSGRLAIIASSTSV